jgi:Na+-transporting NADH:ubiquinone oxidoreductase subunit NqrB
VSSSHRSARVLHSLRNASRDPRYFQMVTLVSLLTYGLLALDFDIQPAQALVTLSTAFVVQYLCTKLFKLPRFDPRSALISGLSLTLLLRSNDLGLIAAAAVITIASKFVLRWKGRHIFNPTCLGIVTMLALSDRVWVSGGQWGQTAFVGFLVACAGMLVVHRAARSDVTFAFLGAYIGLLAARAWWLGDPLSIPLHTIQNGAILLFAFFMISDPKTTPHSRTGRLIFGTLIALGALFVQFGLYEQNGLLWSLAFLALSVPLLDKIFKGSPYNWNQASPSHSATKGGSHASQAAHPQYVPGAAFIRGTGTGFLWLLRR